MENLYIPLVKQAIEQVPALVVVAVLLYVFLKAFERVISNLTKAQDELRELYKETLQIVSNNTDTISKYEGGMERIQTVAAELARAAQLIQFNCPAQKLLNKQSKD